MTDRYFQVDPVAVVYERFDDELVAIHLGRGSYHSVSGAGADVFELLTEAATAPELCTALATKYDASAEKIAAMLDPFLEQLLTEELIQPAERPDRATPLALPAEQTELPFQPPVLEAFNDLEGLLLLDPIHEVGEEGWPEPPDKRPE